MFKKRALLLIFSIFSAGLFSQESAREVILKVFEDLPDVTYGNGVLTFDESIKDLTIYKEKNDPLSFNQSLKIDSDVFTNFNTKDFLKETTIPFDVLVNGYINMDFSFVKKTTYKNISSYIIKAINSTDLDNEQDVTPGRFEKKVVTIGNYPRVVLKCDYYLKSSDKSPFFTYEAEKIVYIDEKYIVTSWSYTDVKKEKEYRFDLNVESLVFDSNKIIDKSILPGSN